MRQAAEHAQAQHGVQVTPELATQVRRQIRDEDTQKDISPTPGAGMAMMPTESK